MSQRKKPKSAAESGQMSLFDEQSAPIVSCFFTEIADLTRELLKKKKPEPKPSLEQRLRHARAH